MPPASSIPGLLAALQAQKAAMLEHLRAWVEMESPSSEPERVRALARQVAAAFEAEGCQATHHPAALQLDYPGSAPSPDLEMPLLLLGHLDTVYPVGTLGRMPFGIADRGIEGAAATGPGVFDMKGGLVQALFALRALRASSPILHPPLVFLFVFDEEIGSPGSRVLTERLARGARAALVLEPAADSDGKLKVARKGIARYRLTAHGVSAHAGLDFASGASAIAELAARVAELASWSDLEQGLTLNPGVIAGGTGANVVAAEARAELDVRAWRAAGLAEIERRLRALKSSNPRVRLELAGGISRPPMEESAATRALFARAQALAAELGFEVAATRVGGASDGNFTAALGLPTLDGLGAVGAAAHSPEEHILLDHLVPRAALLARLFAAA